MANQTSPDAIPYPTLDEPPHGPNQMGALAERLQELFDEAAGGGVSIIQLWDGDSYEPASGARIYVGPEDPGDVEDGSIWFNTESQ